MTEWLRFTLAVEGYRADVTTSDVTLTANRDYPQADDRSRQHVLLMPIEDARHVASFLIEVADEAEAREMLVAPT